MRILIKANFLPISFLPASLFITFFELLGPDWKWGNQDGGNGNIGRVFSVDGGVVEVIVVIEDCENRLNLVTNKGGKFIKKLWCCVGGSITR